MPKPPRQNPIDWVRLDQMIDGVLRNRGLSDPEARQFRFKVIKSVEHKAANNKTMTHEQAESYAQTKMVQLWIERQSKKRS